MDRVAIARERLEGVRRELRAVELLCVDCRHLKGCECHHPATGSHSVDPVVGRIVSSYGPAGEARSANGQCGPEASLFESSPSPVIVAKAAFNGARIAWGIVVSGLALISVLITGH